MQAPIECFVDQHCEQGGNRQILDCSKPFQGLD
jgi:hypothetical protein